MEDEKLHCQCKKHRMHVAMKVVKLALRVAAVAGTFAIASEIHRVHRSLDHQTHRK